MYCFNCGYTSIISGLSIDIIRIKNSIVIYDLLKAALLILICGCLILAVYSITLIRTDLIRL